MTDSLGQIVSNDLVTITVIDACPASTLALATTLYQSVPTSSLDYSVGGTRAGLTWTDTLATLTYGGSAVSCGTYSQTLTYEGFGLTTDAGELFSIDAAGNLSVFTTDAADVGTHTLTATVFLTDYPTITASVDFLVTIIAVETTFTAAYIPDFAYTVGSPLDEFKHGEFTFTTSDGNEAAYSITYTATLVNNADDTDPTTDKVLESSEIEFTAATRKF